MYSISSLFYYMCTSFTEETAILFPPTYRFAKGTRTLDDYVWVKQKRAGVSTCSIVPS